MARPCLSETIAPRALLDILWTAVVAAECIFAFPVSAIPGDPMGLVVDAGSHLMARAADERSFEY